MSRGEQQRLRNIKAGGELFDKLDENSIDERRAKEALRQVFGGSKFGTLKFSDADLLGAAAYQHDYGVNFFDGNEKF